MTAPSFRRRAFSLTELLIVVAVMAVLAGLSVPALKQVAAGSGLTTTGRMVADELALARQTALLRNRAVEVRLYAYASGGGASHYQALQLFRIEDSGAVPLTRVLFFAKQVVLTESSQTTSLLSLSGQPLDGASTGVKLPAIGLSYRYLSFQFRPGGGTNLDITQKWFLTLIPQNAPVAAGGLPANFLTVQIDPAGGKVVTLHP